MHEPEHFHSYAMTLYGSILNDVSSPVGTVWEGGVLEGCRTWPECAGWRRIRSDLTLLLLRRRLCRI